MASFRPFVSSLLPRTALGLVMLAGSACLAVADHAPVYGVPGRGHPGTFLGPPGSVIVGDWGLYRPGFMQPYLVEPPYPTYVPGHATRYFPFDGRVRPVGRYEAPRGVAPRRVPRHSRSWSTPAPVVGIDGTWSAPIHGAPSINPYVILAPEPGRRGLEEK
jgi:hypothetical protein